MRPWMSTVSLRWACRWVTRECPRSIADKRHQDGGIVDRRVIDCLVHPCAVVVVAQPECAVPGGSDEQPVDVESKSAEHPSYVEVLDLGQRVGGTVSDGGFACAHHTRITPLCSLGIHVATGSANYVGSRLRRGDGARSRAGTIAESGTPHMRIGLRSLHLTSHPSIPRRE